jgi:hypothetical protein
MSESVYSPGLGKYVEVVREGALPTKESPTAKPTKALRKRDKDYIHADMKDAVRGCNVTSIVWLRLLQLKTMGKRNPVTLSNEWFERHGVDRWAKNRALRTLQKNGLIKVEWSERRSPRVTFPSPKSSKSSARL